MNPFLTAPLAKKMMTLIGIYIVLVAALLISSCNSILLPAAAKEIGGVEYYPLVTSLTGVLGIAFLPLYGYIAAKSPSSKRMLIVISFVVSGVIMFSRGFANNMWFIIIPSFFFSVYGPAIYVLGYSTIRDMFDAKQAGVFLGLAGTMMSVGMLIGGPLIGALIDMTGWRLPYLIFGPLFIIAALLVLFGVKVSKDEVRHMVSTSSLFDLPGAAATVIFLTAFILVFSLGDIAPFGSPVNNALLIVTAVALLSLIAVIMKKKAEAFIPSVVLTDSNTLCLTSYNFFSTFSTMAIYVFLPLYVTYILRQPSTMAGLTITCMSIAGLFLSPIYGRMIGKSLNARSVAVFVTGVRVVMLVAFIFLLKPTSSIYLVFGLMLVFGIASGGASVVPAVGPQVQILPEKRQLGNSVVQLGSSFGSSISIPIYTMVIGTVGIERGMTISMIIAAVGAGIMFFTNLPLKKL
jgi:MFS family permease